MTLSSLEDDLPADLRKKIISAAVLLPLARMIYSGDIDPKNISEDKFSDIVRSLGKTHENAFEVMVERVDKEMHLVAHCVAEGHSKSGAVLLFTLIEGEVNALLRFHMRIRGLSQKLITDALKGISFDIKLNVLLPLLGVTICARFRNTALQCKAIRNLVVHNKATPNLMFESETTPSDTEIADERATRFFIENPVNRLQVDIKDFFDNGANEAPSVQLANSLIEKYLLSPET